MESEAASQNTPSTSTRYLILMVFIAKNSAKKPYENCSIHYKCTRKRKFVPVFISHKQHQNKQCNCKQFQKNHFNSKAVAFDGKICKIIRNCTPVYCLVKLITLPLNLVNQHNCHGAYNIIKANTDFPNCFILSLLFLNISTSNKRYINPQGIAKKYWVYAQHRMKNVRRIHDFLSQLARTSP